MVECSCPLPPHPSSPEAMHARFDAARIEAAARTLPGGRADYDAAVASIDLMAESDKAKYKRALDHPGLINIAVQELHARRTGKWHGVSAISSDGREQVSTVRMNLPPGYQTAAEMEAGRQRLPESEHAARVAATGSAVLKAANFMPKQMPVPVADPDAGVVYLGRSVLRPVKG